MKALLVGISFVIAMIFTSQAFATDLPDCACIFVPSRDSAKTAFDPERTLRPTKPPAQQLERPRFQYASLNSAVPLGKAMTDLTLDRRTFVGAFAGGLVIARSVAEAQPAAKVIRARKGAGGAFASLVELRKRAEKFRRRVQLADVQVISFV